MRPSLFSSTSAHARLAAILALALVAVVLVAASVLARSPLSVAARLLQDDGVAYGQNDQQYADFDVESAPRLWLEVAATEQQRETGLMFRTAMPWENGMLFVFDQSSRAGFWMHNTLLPLSIAWIDRDGTIVDIQDMEPQTDTVHTPAAPYWYAIESNQGWFAANGVTAGTHATLCVPSS